MLIDMRYITHYVQDDLLNTPQRAEARYSRAAGCGPYRVRCTVANMDMPGLRLHSLKGELKGLWTVTVRANWRVIFRFADPDAFDVDYVDYH
jgi:hypothetical protein